MGSFHHLLLKEEHFWSLPETLIHLPGRNSSMRQDSQCARSCFSIREQPGVRLRATAGGGGTFDFSFSPAWSSWSLWGCSKVQKMVGPSEPGNPYLPEEEGHTVGPFLKERGRAAAWLPSPSPAPLPKLCPQQLGLGEANVWTISCSRAPQGGAGLREQIHPLKLTCDVGAFSSHTCCHLFPPHFVLPTHFLAGYFWPLANNSLELKLGTWQPSHCRKTSSHQINQLRDLVVRPGSVQASLWCGRDWGCSLQAVFQPL